MSDLARSLAIEQRKRLVASVMQYLEEEVYPHLPPEKRRPLRTKVLDSIGTYHDFVLDVIKVNDADAIQNDEVLRLLRLIHDNQRRSSGAGSG